ncbi:hypothetical protein PFICI_04038 [Pestalotiopsis fici W106-1]|uniref:Iso-A82775C biosynthesis cluster protein B n=1 Tax=Pestalotiopsis fici (strain W106-1 / CGMCC3.15140) TaxID=1229662 RepID=IACB_PESFW|nr:uncharacterized protein PFICI_04038 [Pestalotiopsis fici W106-1]A0A1J0KKC6.1 RecName: Full=Iso-A82775C biosynthesis cluster protein B [Pestalotiopsis fici W106-1]APC93981.1 hypothetical protein [Pestalotiopsis fici]ETS86013.1 hypothetical protein PFICI_04038 [Pestalotiopsis fici W106-1]
MASTWFTNIEALSYSVVEFIPYVGTVYSFKRAQLAYQERDWPRHWQSVANFLESAIRDVILFAGVEEVAGVVILHTIAESFTDKLVELYYEHNKDEADRVRQPRIEIPQPQALDPSNELVVVAGRTKGAHGEKVFHGKAKGVHRFHGARFAGTIKHSKYAPSGEYIQLHIPQGLFDGARVTFMWKWTKDEWGTENRPEVIVGTISLYIGDDKLTWFKFTKRQGAGWRPGEGSDFNCKVASLNLIIASTTVGDESLKIDLERI